MINTDNKGFTIENTSEFNREYQPTLPKGFPKELIPREKCQEVLTTLLLCSMNSSSNLCAVENKNYYMCRRERDANLFGAIERWELAQYGKQKNKAAYRQELQDQKAKLEEQIEKMPQVIATRHKRWRYQADAEQLGWRLGYLND